MRYTQQVMGTASHRGALLFLAVAGIGAVAAPSHAESDSPARRQLLGGRVTLEVPRGASIHARGGVLMEAPFSDEDETRVTIDRGVERLVLLAAETFQQAGTQPLEGEGVAALAKRFWSEPLQPGPFTIARGFRAVKLVPSVVKSDQDANLVALYLVALTDNLVISFAFYVNPDAALQSAHHAEVAERMMRSLEMGAQRLVTTAGVRSLGDVVAAVPANYVLRRHEGIDFTVYRLQRITPVGGREASMTAYLGYYPPPESGTATERGKLLGSKVTWKISSEHRTGLPDLLGRETTLPLAGRGEKRIQVSLFSDDDSLMRELRAIAKSLAMAPPAAAAHPLQVHRREQDEQPHAPWAKLADTAHNADAIVLDEDRIYVGDMGGSVYSVPKAGGALTVLAHGTGWASSLAFDDANVYWSGQFSDSIYKVDKAGGHFAIVARNTTNKSVDCSTGRCSGGIDGLVAKDRYLYWANDDAIWRMDKAGDSAEPVATAQPGATKLQCDGKALYWINERTGDILRLAFNSSTPATLVATHTGSVIFTVANGFLYWLANEDRGHQAIRRVPATGGDCTLVGVPPASNYFMSLAADEKYVYWTSQEPQAIRKMAIAGGVSSTVALDQPDPLNIAVDASGVYWTNQHGEGSVMALPK